MSDIGINQVLSQMRAMQAMARNERSFCFGKQGGGTVFGAHVAID
jgi:hypothetical protein